MQIAPLLYDKEEEDDEPDGAFDEPSGVEGDMGGGANGPGPAGSAEPSHPRTPSDIVL